MFFSESKLLCSPEYLAALIAHSKYVSDKTLDAVNIRIEAGSIPITPQLSLDKNQNAHVYIYGPLVSSPDPFLFLFSNQFTTYQSIQNKIDKVYLHINSPGGVVGEVDNTWQAIMDLRKDFEVIAINEGDMASGAYWLASAANKIISTSETNKQGSIGVIHRHIDSSKMDERIGIEEKIFTSKNAKYKHPSQEGFDEKLQKNLDDMEEIFVDRISKGRGLTKDDIYANFGKGSMLLSNEAKKVGMIDNIIPLSQLFFSDQDRPVTGDKSKLIQGDNEKMTLEEMLNDPGVQAEITKQVTAAKKLGKQDALSEVKNVMVFLSSDEYPKSVQDCALAVCEGLQPKVALDTLVAHVDQERASAAALAAEQDANNQEPLPGVKPEVTPEIR
jgi:ClpP class serine protease